MTQDVFGARASMETAGGSAVIYRLDRLEKAGHSTVSRLPFSIKVLLEEEGSRGAEGGREPFWPLEHPKSSRPHPLDLLSAHAGILPLLPV